MIPGRGAAVPNLLAAKSREALIRALHQNGPARLVSSGAKAPGLFAAARSNEATSAIQQCRAEGWLEIVDQEVKTARKTTVVAHATLTAAGIERLFLESGPSERLELLTQASPLHRPNAQAAFAKAIHEEWSSAQAALKKATDDENEAADQLKAVLKHRHEQAKTARAELERRCQEIEHSLTEVEVKRPSESKVPEAPGPGPITSSDLDFQREKCRQLVNAWREVSSPEARQQLEDVLFNIGVEQLGERGEQIPFDNSIHQVDRPVEHDALVEVVEPGWRLTNQRGSYLISPTQVRAIEVSEHAPHDLH
jgi:hypothetical protein